MADSKGVALIVDDDATNRAILEALIKQEGYQIVSAEDGAQAVQCFAEHSPDIVFMDVMMPVIDGYEATTRIKALAGARFVPVIFLTAQTEDEALVKCITSGGDDFLSKPYKRTIMRAKIAALERIRDLSRTVATQHHVIERNHQQLLREQEIAEHIYSAAVTASNVVLEHLHVLLRPAATFSGDLLLTGHHPDGSLHALLGDFTGHGLTAAIGALPVSEVFHAMTTKGYAAPEIQAAINGKLHRLLPVGMFMAACFVVVDRDLRSVTVWNSAMPDVLVVDGKSGAVKHRVASQSLAFGIQPDTDYLFTPTRLEVNPGDRILLCSDGVTDARGPDGECFGDARYLQAAIAPPHNFQAITQSLDEFCGGQPLIDDMSLIEIPLLSGLLALSDDVQDTEWVAPPAREGSRGHWRWSLELNGSSLHNVNPVPIAISQLLEIESLTAHRQALFTVLAEMYSNALDHGVLGLDSGIKSSAHGFSQYYSERKDRLEKLQVGFVRIEMEHVPQRGKGKLLIRMQDSGHGFDFKHWEAQPEDNTGFSGRGVVLLRNLCESVRYVGNGNQIEASFVWDIPASCPENLSGT